MLLYRNIGTMSNKWLSLEEQIERILEQPFFRLFGGQLEPVDVAKRLGRAMEDGRVLSAGKALAPNSYTVWINREDLAEFEGYKDTVKQEITDYLRDLARTRNLVLIGQPHITFKIDERLPRGKLNVDAEIVDRTLNDQTMAFTSPLDADEIRKHAGTAAGAQLRYRDRVIPINQPFLTLGRSVDNDVILESDDVSRHHAQIKLRQGSYVLTDLDSANGTSINDTPVDEPRVLRDGDRIRVAHVELIFELPSTWRKTS